MAINSTKKPSLPLQQPTEERNISSAIQLQHSSWDRNCPYVTTEAMADRLGIQAQSVRKRYSQTGTYFGLRPVKLPNRRLMWASDALAKFLRGEGT